MISRDKPRDKLTTASSRDLTCAFWFATNCVAPPGTGAGDSSGSAHSVNTASNSTREKTSRSIIG